MTCQWSRRLTAVLVGVLLAIPAMAGDAGPSSALDLPVAPERVRAEAAGAGSPTSTSLFPNDRVAALRTELEAMLRTGSRTEQWSLMVTSVDLGDTLVAVNADVSMAPASNMKLFTSAAALHLLGPDFRFPTYLLADGPVVDGVLEGNLVLYGTGDPTLGTRSPANPGGAFAAFLEALEAAGIREVQGHVVGDASYYTGDPRRPSWNPTDLDDWFAAPVSALTFNENMVTLRVAPERSAGLPTRVFTIPEGADVPVRNQSRVTASGGPAVAIFRDDPDGPIQVVGTMRPREVEAWRTITVSDPPSYAASVLRVTLEAAGIPVQGFSGMDTGVPRSVSDRLLVAPAFGTESELRTLAVHHSPPVSELIHPVNKRSHNLFAEVLLFAMGRVTGESPDFEGGARALQRFLVEEVGVDAEALRVEDGSGLSRLNRTTARDLVRILGHMETSPYVDEFHASLPEAGNRRELGRMNRSAAAGNLRAKTGTIHRTSALSGTVTGADGERLLFSILVNDVPSTWAAKRAEDRVGIHLAGFQRGETGLPGLDGAGRGFRAGVGAAAATAPAVDGGDRP